MKTSQFIALVRPIVTFIAVIGLTTGFFLNKVTADAYVPLMAMVVTYWYKSRDETNRKENK